MASVAGKNAGQDWELLTPMDERWNTRLRQEVAALISLIKKDKENSQGWFTLRPENERGITWKGTCMKWHKDLKYEFALQVVLPATYPLSPPEISLPELKEKSEKLYRGGHICLDIHFTPVWHERKGAGGIAFALVHGLGPWLASEIPVMVERGVL